MKTGKSVGKLAVWVLLCVLAMPVTAQTVITSLNQITDSGGSYLITDDITGGAPGVDTFTGTLTAQAKSDGTFPVISGLTQPLFTTVTGATISNIMLKDVTISQSGYVGAIACTANGASRIYNCGILPTTTDASSTSSIASTNNYCGSLVGFLDGTARVINCFSFANITGGTVKAGIVGYNNYGSKSGDIKTMVMNCVFYGDIATTAGVGVTDESIYPIYGGTKISNEDGFKLNNYNYFLFEASYSDHRNIPDGNYNCALAAEKRYLVRWEFYRYLLNSTREIATWYVFGNTDDAHSRMMKWVLDRSMAPYPILKRQDSYTPGAYTSGLYPSVVNYDPVYTFHPETGEKVSRSSVTTRNGGGLLTAMGTSGMLSVTISESNTTGGGQTKPTGATVNITSRTLPIIDKDTALFNFNYGKVQLPYYNEVGTGNYTYDRVVTGWKITAITPVEGDPYTSDNYTGNKYDAPNYNFSDRKSSNKDLYGVSGRVFSQGAYFDVPDGVSSITIEPYWACAAYVSDLYYDCYGKNQYEMGNGVTDFGQRYVNSQSYSINGNSQKVYSTIANGYGRLESLGLSASSSIYDYAIVLVGNNHQKGSPKNEAKHFTIMSADLNFDNEPDYSLIITTGKQEKISPIRFDFINVPNVAMAHKKTSNTYMGIFGNIKPKGWFETTNTAVLRFSQYEYDSEYKSLNEPLILMGGLIDMFTSTNGSAASTHTNYMIVGGNVWFQVFNIGCHMDQTYATPHRPISVCGGEYEKFYLSGYLKPDATPYTAVDGGQNAECYISGGRFGEVAGAGYEQIVGNVTWQIYDADMENFYGGGINENKPVTGNITTTIRGGYVGTYCGGPKFGNMSSGKTLSTTANDCIFGTYFGAGYGGSAFTRINSYNRYGSLTYNWNGSTENQKIVPQFTESNGPHHRGKYITDRGISVNYDYRNFEGSSTNTVAYLFVNYASMSLARTNNVTSELTNCTITGNFYGGGSLGVVEGNAVSTLTDCTVLGNAFGAGFSVEIPTVEVFPDGDAGLFNPIPKYNSITGVFEKGGYPTPVTYTWSSKGANTDSNSLVDDAEGHWIHTGQDLNSLGTVKGDATLTLIGSTTVQGNVFGGGDESAVEGNTSVFLQDATNILGNVFGGGNKGQVGGDSKVIVKNPTTPEP